MKASPDAVHNPIAARRVLVDGRVQGVGFRPFVYRLAHQYHLHGWVYNASGAVHILAEGADRCLNAFISDLVSKAPPLARPRLASCEPVKVEGHTWFAIRESQSQGKPRIHIPPDQFACPDCVAELHDRAARRYRYPFINCTQCGPRYTIIRAMPYDRPNTTMAGFPLCEACDAEYRNPLDRRFHAQPLACDECGPRLVCRDGSGVTAGNEAALAACVRALEDGLIVAVRGIGGYHLMCDAGNEQAVADLRRRKNRPDKPLAVMVPPAREDSLGWAARLAVLDHATGAALADPVRPIVLAPRRPDAPLAAGIAPGLAEVGLMLPYSPLHHLLLGDFGRPVVATSGNVSGEPVLTDPAEVETRLGTVADVYLHHNRPIERPADDPVMRPIDAVVRPIRLGRGNAPVEIALPFRLSEPLLAVGAFLKNTVALAWEDRAMVSPHIGDLGSPRARSVLVRVAEDLQALYGIRARAVACDAHPDFANSRWAKTLGLPISSIFHHHAHASALAAEFGVADEMLCFTWDGVGLGEDHTLWGGEALLGKPGSWRRVASFRPFRLPGGERAAHEPWRCALGLCWEAGETWHDGAAFADELLQRAWSRTLNAPLTTAVGRLFDAAAALAGVVTEASYEGQGPMQFEALCRDPGELVPLALRQDAAGIWRTDWAPLIPVLQVPSLAPNEKADIFHASMARALLRQALVIRRRHGVNRVGLTGGVFQNRILTALAHEFLQLEGFEVLIPEKIPVNDAGISFGQIVEAAARMGSAAGPVA